MDSPAIHLLAWLGATMIRFVCPRCNTDLEQNLGASACPVCGHRLPGRSSATATSSGLLCALASLGLLPIAFVLLWITANVEEFNRGPGKAIPLVLVMLLVALSSIVLAVLSVVVSKRGLNESNTS